MGYLAALVKVSLVGGWLNWRKKLIPAYLVASSRSQKCFKNPDARTVQEHFTEWPSDFIMGVGKVLLFQALPWKS